MSEYKKDIILRSTYSLTCRLYQFFLFIFLRICLLVVDHNTNKSDYHGLVHYLCQMMIICPKSWNTIKQWMRWHGAVRKLHLKQDWLITLSSVYWTSLFYYSYHSDQKPSSVQTVACCYSASLVSSVLGSCLVQAVVGFDLLETNYKGKMQPNRFMANDWQACHNIGVISDTFTCQGRVVLHHLKNNFYLVADAILHEQPWISNHPEKTKI